MVIIGIETVSLMSLGKTVFSMIRGVNIGLTATFFLLYILMSFINKFIENINKKQFTILLFILFFFYTVIPTFFVFNDTFNEIGWYISMYLVGGYIRLYLDNIKLSIKKSLVLILTNLVLIVASILVLDTIGHNPYHMVINANKFFALTLAISLFMVFKNINLRYSKWINKLSSVTFGVLLIHANSDAMRDFLWVRVLNVSSFYSSSICSFMLL